MSVRTIIGSCAIIVLLTLSAILITLTVQGEIESVLQILGAAAVLIGGLAYLFWLFKLFD